MKVKELIEELLKVEDQDAEILLDRNHVDILVEYEVVEYHRESSDKFVHLLTWG